MKTHEAEDIDEYIEFLVDTRGLKEKSAKEYRGYLRRVSEELGMRIDRSTVSCEEDVLSIRSRLLKKATHPGKVKKVGDWVSALRAYYYFVNVHTYAHTSADEIVEKETFLEGAKRRVAVNAYERDPEARRLCIKRYGWDCTVCGMNFAKTYGEIGKCFIHVHHKKQLSTLGKDYRVDPKKDLIPVCPNCHAMLHRRREMLSIEKLKALYRGTTVA